VADNFVANAGSGGSTFAADDISSVLYPRVKVSWSADGVAPSDSALAAPFPVQNTIESSQMTGAGVILTPKFAAIAASSSGNNTLVAAVASKKIRVVAATFMSNGTVNAKFQSGAGGTDLTGLYYMVANTGGVLPYNPVGWFETAVNTLLNFNLSGAVAVGGSLTYVEVA
jgi:hypothetical protein